MAFWKLRKTEPLDIEKTHRNFAKMTESMQTDRDMLPKLFELNRLVAEAEKALDALPQLVNLIRDIFVFDNLVIYLAEKDKLIPYFARAVGRGRAKEADVAWGVEVARRIYKADETIVKRESLEDTGENRLLLRYYLGIPLKQSGRKIGAVIFIRFGGPEYDVAQIRLAEFIAEHLAHLLEREQLVSKVNALERGRQLGKMQEDFVATVSHDLRTPLGFIKGYTTTLLRKDVEWDKETYQEFLEIIDDEADRLRILIDNFLDSSRLQSGTLHMQFQNIRLTTVLKDVVERIKIIGFNLVVDLHSDCSEIVINGTPARLAQVFNNLLDNANKYAPKSTVTVQLEKIAGKAHVIVRDTGPGIGEEHLEKIFNRFYRIPGSDAGARGSGLGLFICRQIIEAHHGKIFAESMLDEGTTFHIYLPIVS